MSMPLTTALSRSLPSSTEQIVIPAPRPFSPFSSSSSSRKFLGTFAGIMRERFYQVQIKYFPRSASVAFSKIGEENAIGGELGLGMRSFGRTSPVTGAGTDTYPRMYLIHTH